MLRGCRGFGPGNSSDNSSKSLEISEEICLKYGMGMELVVDFVKKFI